MPNRIWWDQRAQRYRSSLPYKVFYVGSWQILRWVLFRLLPEIAHYLAIRGIWLEDEIERIWD